MENHRFSPFLPVRGDAASQARPCSAAWARKLALPRQHCISRYARRPNPRICGKSQIFPLPPGASGKSQIFLYFRLKIYNRTYVENHRFSPFLDISRFARKLTTAPMWKITDFPFPPGPQTRPRKLGHAVPPELASSLCLGGTAFRATREDHNHVTARCWGET